MAKRITPSDLAKPPKPKKVCKPKAKKEKKADAAVAAAAEKEAADAAKQVPLPIEGEAAAPAESTVVQETPAPVFKTPAEKRADLAAPSPYAALGNAKKDVSKPQTGGFFSFPDEVVGSKDQNQQKFLIFYFKNLQDYEDVLKVFFLKGGRSHPLLDDKKLADIVRRYANDTAGETGTK